MELGRSELYDVEGGCYLVGLLDPSGGLVLQAQAQVLPAVGRV